MKLYVIPSFTIFLTLMSCTDRPNMKTNQLKNEKSPYLRQHKDNPIWWQNWSQKSLQHAEKNQKLIFLSIGYSTCHWCHVMEHESFENTQVAKAINGRYIPIKVDREERPDVDSIYMSAVQAMTGSGGWPLTLVLTPDRQPVFGATYVPREKLIPLLAKIQTTWLDDPKKIKDIGKNLVAWLAKEKATLRSGVLTSKIFLQFKEQMKSRYDPLNGGYKGAPKFPPTYALRLLLRIQRRHRDPEIITIINRTLKKMSHGGIYDHLMGGFHRYATDETWTVPHFEKMLYDQSALAMVYLEAYQVTNNPEYALVVKEILNYVLREMMQKQGGFYSAQDADSEGHEGLFAVWSWQELNSLLTVKELKLLVSTYGVSQTGNFEGKNILTLNEDLSRQITSPVLISALAKLRKRRLNRIQPIRDDKIIVAWNGLMISALAQAGRILKQPKYSLAAQSAAEFIWIHLRNKNGTLLRRWIQGEAKHPAMLNDYAFLIDGYLELYQSIFDVKWFERAVTLQQIQDEVFWDNNRKFYYSSDGKDPSLITRPKNFYDNVTPAGSSVTLYNLLRLYDLSQNSSYKTKSSLMLTNQPANLLKHPTPFPYFLMALDYALDRSKEVAIIGTRSDAQSIYAHLLKPFNPNKIFSIGITSNTPLLKSKIQLNNKPTVYICEQGLCQLPVTNPQEALKQLTTYKPY